jgi:hypothetical protein
MPDDIRGPSLISSEQADILSRWSTVEVGFERKAPPYLSYRSYFAYFFRTMEPPIAGPARFPGLISLISLISHISATGQHGERTAVAGWRHVNQRSLMGLQIF